MANFDVIIIGGGPAGYVSAIRCAQLGLSVAVVEKDRLGGVCVNIGCIPTKALLYSAQIARVVSHEAADLGIAVDGVRLDYGVAMKRSRRVADQNAKGAEFLLKKNKVTVLKGTGTLLSNTQVQVGAEAHVAAKAIILATGSRVKGIPQIGLEINKSTVISSDEALFLAQAPGSIAVVGAGAVGCEFADIFNAFGSKVTLIEALPRILPLEDADASDVVAKSFKKRGIDSYPGAKVIKADVGASGVTLHLQVGGETKVVEAEKVLMAAGRAVNTEGMGLQQAGVELDPRGFVAVNLATLETTAKGVYAIGDVAGPPMLAHKGSREGVVVAEIIAGHPHHPIRYDNIPSVTYCHPEVASIGMSEDQVKAGGMGYRVGKFPFSANGRARASNETEGFVKIIRGAQYGEILGAHIVGGHASELIHELGLARENEYTVEEIDLFIHAHPTLSEAIAEASLDSMGRVLHT